MTSPESPKSKEPKESKESKESMELLSFEVLMQEIDRLTALLERGDIPLEEALAAFERGMALSKRAATMLEGAESRLVRLMEGDRGEVREVPLELAPSGVAEVEG